jgi:hypothetical protein
MIEISGQIPPVIGVVAATVKRLLIIYVRPEPLFTWRVGVVELYRCIELKGWF